MDKALEEKTIELIRKNTEELAKLWGRPEEVFKIDKDKAALLVIDVQNFTCRARQDKPSERDMKEQENMINNINGLSKKCRKENIPVIWVKHNLTINDEINDSGLYGKFFKSGIPEIMCNRNEGTEIYKDLYVDKEKDYFIFKNRYSAFLPQKSALHGLLDKLEKKQLIITGLATNVCVESTIRDAMQLDFEVILASDGTASINKIMYEMSLANVKLFLGDVRKTEDIISDL